MSEGDPRLFNPYGVIAVNPKKWPHVKYDLAKAFIEYITSEEGQNIIGDFKKNGGQLFFPDAVKYAADERSRRARSTTLPSPLGAGEPAATRQSRVIVPGGAR